MKEYIERTEELVLAVNAGARAIENNKRYHGTAYCIDVFSNNPREIPYLKAAEVLRSVDEIPAAKVIEAPCDIGDVFWRIDHVRKLVERVKVSGLTKKANGTWKIRITCHYGVYEIVPSEIGKHVFRTEEEAEAALNERVH